MKFKCIYEKGTKIEKWEVKVKKIQKYNSHYEINIESRSSIMLMYGETSRGGFACMPDFNVGCHLVNLKDRFWNSEKLVNILGYVDGITVETALYNLANEKYI
jgi:hypothetical protein